MYRFIKGYEINFKKLDSIAIKMDNTYDSIERINVVLATTLTRSISVVCDEIDLPSAIAILALNGKIAYYTKRRISDTPIIEIPNDVDVK